MSCSRITKLFLNSFATSLTRQTLHGCFSLIHVRISFSSPYSSQHHSCKKKKCCEIICILTSYIFFHVTLHHSCKIICILTSYIFFHVTLHHSCEIICLVIPYVFFHVALITQTQNLYFSFFFFSFSSSTRSLLSHLRISLLFHFPPPKTTLNLIFL